VGRSPRKERKERRWAAAQGKKGRKEGGWQPKERKKEKVGLSPNKKPTPSFPSFV